MDDRHRASDGKGRQSGVCRICPCGWSSDYLMVGPLHWIVEITHLTLGILTIGLGHMGAARYRKKNSA